MKGSLTGFSLKEIFEMLGATGKTGVLEVTGAYDEDGRACFRDGLLYWAQAETGEEDSSGRGPLEERIEDSIFEIFEWESDAYKFNVGETIDQGEQTGLKVETVLADVDKRRVEWAEIRKEIPSMRAKIGMISTIDTKSVALTREQWEVVVSIGQGSTVEDLRTHLRRSPISVCRILCEMSKAGLIRCLGEIEGAEPGTEKVELAAKKEAGGKKYIRRSLVADNETDEAVPAEWASYYQLLDSRKETIKTGGSVAVNQH